MVYGLYSVQDVVAGNFNAPFMVVNDQMAEAAFRRAIQCGQVPHWRDQVLFRVGQFDDETGVLFPVNPEILVRGANCQAAVQADLLQEA